MDRNTIYVVTGSDESATTKMMASLIEGGMRAAYDKRRDDYHLSLSMVCERHFPLRYHGKLIKLPTSLIPLLTPQKNIIYQILSVDEDIDMDSRNDVLFSVELYDEIVEHTHSTFVSLYASGWPIDIDLAERRFNQ